MIINITDNLTKFLIPAKAMEPYTLRHKTTGVHLSLQQAVLMKAGLTSILSQEKQVKIR